MISDHLGSDDPRLFPSSPPSHRFTSPPLPDIPVLDPASKRRTLPPELLEHIVERFYQRYRSFRALRPLSEANSQFRIIALRIYMTSLRIPSAKQLTSLLKVHMSILSRGNPTWGRVGFHWVKNLSALSLDLAKAPWRPDLMGNLRDLHISFVKDGRSTQKSRLAQIFSVPLGSPMTQITSLVLTELWRIDVSLLTVVAGAFPGLTSLHLSCSEHLDMSCCWACFEDSSSAVVHSPIPNHFPTVASLTTAFATALKSLTKLTDLHLGFFLSDEEMLENHIDHYDSPKAYSRALQMTLGQNRNPVRTETVLSQSESPNPLHPEHVSYTGDSEERDSEIVARTAFDEVPPFPHGPDMCPICSIVVSAPAVRTRELEASLALALKLKSLRTISWSSFFALALPSEDERRTGDWERASKTYVFRSGGRVRVRRRPWDQSVSLSSLGGG